MNSVVQENGLYPIGTVSALTGVNSVTLRAWERRYGLLNPTRTASGHRLYTQADIELIKSILQLLDEGIAISRVANAMQQTQHPETEAANQPWQRYQQQMLTAVCEFDEATLENIYNETMSLYPVDVVTRQLLLPLLELLGQRWQHETAGIAEEHFFSLFLRNKLGARFHHRNQLNTGPRLIAACLPGEQHEFGLLLFSLAAHARGYRIILLGADMPLQQLPEVVKRTQVDGIALSGSKEAVKQPLEAELSKLVLESQVPVFIGGSYAQQRQQALHDIGVHPIGNDLVVGLHNIARQLPSSSTR